MTNEVAAHRFPRTLTFAIQKILDDFGKRLRSVMLNMVSRVLDANESIGADLLKYARD